MLVLTRKRNERIVIDGNIVVTIVAIGPERVRVGVDAPKHVNIVREELVALAPDEEANADTEQPKPAYITAGGDVVLL